MMPLGKAQGGLRYKVCPDCGEMHDVRAWPDNHRRPGEALCAPNYVSDIMEPVQSQGNGKLYDSKSEIRKHYRQDGFVEVGNDPARHRPRQKPKPDRMKIKDAVQRAAVRFSYGERFDRHKIAQASDIAK